MFIRVRPGPCMYQGRQVRAKPLCCHTSWSKCRWEANSLLSEYLFLTRSMYNVWVRLENSSCDSRLDCHLLFCVHTCCWYYHFDCIITWDIWYYIPRVIDIVDTVILDMFLIWWMLATFRGLKSARSCTWIVWRVRILLQFSTKFYQSWTISLRHFQLKKQTSTL